MKAWMTKTWIARFAARRRERRFVLDDLFPFCFVVEFAGRGGRPRPDGAEE